MRAWHERTVPRKRGALRALVVGLLVFASILGWGGGGAKGDVSGGLREPLAKGRAILIQSPLVEGVEIRHAFDRTGFAIRVIRETTF